MELGRFGVWGSFDGGSLADAVEAAQRIEALGYAALWQPIALRRDVMVTASQQLAATQRLVVATGIATIYERAPLVMVAAQRALAEQSGGRFLLGLGCSHRPLTQPLFAREYEPPLRAMREYLDRMDGGIAFPGTAGGPPSAGPRVLAALGPKMLALARDRAHGAHPYFMPPEHTRRAREILGPDRWLCPEVKVVLETDPARARALARAAGATNIALPNYRREWLRLGFEAADFASGGSDRLIDSTVAWGDVAAIRKHLDRHFEAGATQVCIHAVGPAGIGAGPDWKALEALAPGGRA
ncbi:MAG TPA: TIGR03620 family F420-dependent LLM class oxidoreductase [Myxococcota bacterium]|nr:TIGR03620 family F420-dependent LLM class oxidoreductase [Myxococcota bacterium]